MKRNSFLQTVSLSSVLVVQPGADVFVTAAELSAAGFDVAVAESYHKAKTFLIDHRPGVLLTDIRLAEYNGLQLVLHGQAIRTGTAAVVLSDWNDSVIQKDAEQLGATFMVKPITAGDLLAAVLRTVFAAARNEVSSPVRPPFERRQRDRRAGAHVVTGAADCRHSERRQSIAELLSRLSLSA